MSLIRAKEYLKKFNLENNIMEFNTSSATVEEAAKALNCEEKEIAKTLSFLVNDEVILIVVAGDKKIDNAKYKAEFNTKAKMIPYDDVENYAGHKPGGVCPFGVKENVKVYLDESLKRFDIIYPACGSSNSAVKLTIAELEKTSNYEKWVYVKMYKEVTMESNEYLNFAEEMSLTQIGNNMTRDIKKYFNDNQKRLKPDEGKNILNIIVANEQIIINASEN